MSGLDKLVVWDVSPTGSLALVFGSPLLPLAGSESGFAAHCDSTEPQRLDMHKKYKLLTGCSMTLSSVSEQGLSPR